MAKDIRVIIIKLADRLHNMRTLQYMRPEKQKEKARETIEIYSPLADRLGISKIKIELDDLALRYLEPNVYKELEEKIALTSEARQKFIDDIIAEIKTHMEHAEIGCEVNGRVKHFFSIYKKMVNQHKTLDQIYDLFAVRIIVESVKRLLRSSGCDPRDVQTDSGTFQRLYCDAEAKYVPVSAYDADRTNRSAI